MDDDCSEESHQAPTLHGCYSAVAACGVNSLERPVSRGLQTLRVCAQ